MPVYLVCEGFPQALDRRVIQALVIHFHNLNVLVEPAGGSKGHGAVRSYLESRSPGRDVAIAVEDRDYRPIPEANATWANQAGKSFIWRRHEIENYLLHPQVVLEFFEELHATHTWAGSLPTNEADASALLQSLARPLLEAHAAEVLKDDLVRQINSMGSLSFGPQAAVPALGSHFPGKTEWLPALQNEAARLTQACATVGAATTLQPAEMATRYDALLAQFQNPAFLHSGDYLGEMKGKDLLAALSRHLSALGASAKLNRDTLANALLRLLEQIYQPNSIYQPDDFGELAQILRQY